MNFEEIKEYRNAERFPAVLLNDEVLDWLIAEVEKYQKLIAGNSQLQIDWIDVTAKRCAEIAGQTSKVAEHRIKEEFKL